MIAIQILGTLFALFLLYHTYHNYRRKIFGKRILVLWSILWLGMVVVTIFPASVNVFLEALRINRALDFFTITSILVLFAIVFQMYTTVQRLESRVERYVREEALKNVKHDG